jgi:hypothetical protein
VIKGTNIKGVREMRRVLFLSLVFVALISHDTSAQLIKQFGVKVAVTSANQGFDYSQMSDLQMKRRVGFDVGVFAEWLDIPVLSIISQIEYAQKGSGMEFVVTGPSGPQSLGTTKLYSRLDYLSVPILLKLRLQSSVITPYLLAGPRLDILMSYQSDEGVLNSLYDQFKKTTLGGSVGVGVQIQSLLPVTILVEGRYNIDLSDSYETNLLKVRNNSFDFWLGVAL